MGQTSQGGAFSGSRSMLGPAVELIVRFGDADRARSEHLPDQHQRCRACTLPGYGTPHLPWPCLLYIIATEAAEW